MPNPTKDFLWDSQTSGFSASTFSLFTTELNSLGSGLAVTASVGGSSGVFSATQTGNYLYLPTIFNFGGSNTPAVGGVILIWFLPSFDGGSTFETQVATASTTVMALPRPADVTIPLSNAAYASGNKARCSGLPIVPTPSFKAVFQNLSGGALPVSGNIVTCAPLSTGY